MLSKKLFCSLRKVPNRVIPRNTCGRFTSVQGSHVFSLSQNRALTKQRLRQNGQRSHERSESQNCEAMCSEGLARGGTRLSDTAASSVFTLIGRAFAPIFLIVFTYIASLLQDILTVYAAHA